MEERVRLQLLFVEDNPDDVELTVLQLQRDGFAVDWRRVDSEAELRENLTDWRPDAILLDHSMPTLNSSDALEAVKQLAPAVPVIVVSGTIVENRALEFIQQGAVDYVLKDNMIRLSAAVRRAVEEAKDRSAYEKKIHFLTNFNPLTELPNRALLVRRVEEALLYAERSPSCIGVIILNIDGFKLINDAYGTAIGDELLKQLGRRINKSVGKDDMVAHLEADTFAILAAGLFAPDDIIGVVRDVQSMVQEQYVIDGRALDITTSIGVSLHPRDGETFDSLFRNARAALHRAKERGEGVFQFYDPEMTASALDRIETERGLHRALARNELELHYQPQISLADGKIVGAEALIRWHHPVRGLVPPGEFLPVAEKSDLIYLLGDWALLAACRQARAWRNEGLDLRVAVNVSAKQFHKTGFVDRVREVLHVTGLAPAFLELELTESALIRDYKEIADILNDLDSLGVRIALDDFGTGYSNLSYLTKLPIHCLKIDQSFVRGACGDSGDMEIVKAVIALARAFKLHVIGEGIETQQQVEFLRGLGCDEGQGFLLSKPLPAREFRALLQAADPGMSRASPGRSGKAIRPGGQ